MMSRDEFEVFREIGVTVPTEAEAAALAVRQERAHAERLTALRAASMTLDKFASATGLDVTEVRAHITGRSLWAFDDESRIPAWELHEGALLPGLDAVVPRIPAGTSPTAVETMLTNPTADLYVDGAHVSVVEWLRARLAPDIAAAVIGSPAELT